MKYLINKKDDEVLSYERKREISMSVDRYMRMQFKRKLRKYFKINLK
jgi:hypothetical protein